MLDGHDIMQPGSGTSSLPYLAPGKALLELEAHGASSFEIMGMSCPVPTFGGSTDERVALLTRRNPVINLLMIERQVPKHSRAQEVTDFHAFKLHCRRSLALS